MDGETTKTRQAHKRADGDGSMYQRKDGLWVGELMAGYRPDGKPDRRRVSAKTQAECRRKLADLRLRAQQGTLTEKAIDRLTVADFFTRWSAAAAGTVRATTWKSYADLIRRFIVADLGRKLLVGLRADDIQRLYAACALKGLAPGSIRRLHAVLHRALKDAVRWGYLSRNVADAVDPPAIPHHELVIPTAAELRQLLDAARMANDPLTSLWIVAIYGGLRQGELLGLQWSDLDLERGRLTVQRNLLRSTIAGVPSYGEPKTARSRRNLTLDAPAVDALRMQRSRQIADRLKLGPDYASFNLVFATALGTPLGHRNVLRSFKMALQRAGLPATVRLHDLRHASATLMLAGGVPLTVASRRLGHSTIRVTADLYQHVDAALDTDAAERLGRALQA